MKQKTLFRNILGFVFLALMTLTFSWNFITLIKDFKYTVFIEAIIFLIFIIGIVLLVKRFAIFYPVQCFFIFLIALVIRIIWILNVSSIPVSDFNLIYQASLDWVKGDMTFINTPYFKNWSYQLGYTWFQSIIIRIFGEGFIAIKVINCILSSITCLVIFITAKKLFGSSVAIIAGLLTATDIGLVSMCSVLTNQHIAILLFYFAFYILISYEDKKYMWIVAGVVAALGNLMRPIGIVVLTAVIVYSLFFTCSRKLFDRHVLIKISIFLFTYIVVGFLISRIFIFSGITEEPLGNRNPLWKFITGLNYETKGRYSDADLEYLSGYKSSDERIEREKQLIIERITSFEKLPELFKDKYKIMWVNMDYTVNWSIHNTEPSQKHFFGFSKEKFYAIVLGIDKSVYTVGLLLTFIGSIYILFFNKSPHNGIYLYMLVILIYIFIHLFIEIQPRYRLFILPGIYIMSSSGIKFLSNFKDDDILIK